MRSRRLKNLDKRAPPGSLSYRADYSLYGFWSPNSGKSRWTGKAIAIRLWKPHNKKSTVRRILIAEDHKRMRAGLRALIEEKLGYESIAEANDGYAAVSKCKELKPDFVIMDIGLPKLNGIEATRQVIARDLRFLLYRRERKLMRCSVRMTKRKFSVF